MRPILELDFVNFMIQLAGSVAQNKPTGMISFLMAQTLALCTYLDPDKKICSLYIRLINKLALNIVDQSCWSLGNRSNLDLSFDKSSMDGG